MQVADQRYQVDEFSVPKIGPDEGLLKIEACGMCGSDVEQYDGAFAALGVTYPVIAGHEPIGTIEEIGAAAAQRWNVRVGDRVAIEPVLSCGHCRPCLTGRYRRCATGRPGAGQVNCYGYLPTSVRPSLWGGYAEYMYLDPQTVLHKLDPALPIELAALYQPMAAGVRWFAHESNLALGDTVVILGCGQRGLAGLVAAREAGAGRVIVTGLESDAHKLDIARRLGADATIIADREDTVERVREITDGRMADVVVDVSAVSIQPVLDALDIATGGGTIILGGVKGSAAVASLRPDKIVVKELNIRGVFSQDIRAFEPALRLIESRKYPLEQLHTHTFGLDQVDLAVQTLAGRVDNEKAVHVMITP